MSQIVWTDGPGTVTPARIPIPLFNVPPGEESYLRFLGSPYVTTVHWVGPRTLPHTGDTCPLCIQGHPKRQNGFAPAQRWYLDCNGVKNWVSVVVSLADSALLDLSGHDVRGQVWTLFRVDKRVRSQLMARFCEYSKTPVPDCFDPRPTVEWIWRGYMAEINRPVPKVAQAHATRTGSVEPEVVGDIISPLRGRLAELHAQRGKEGGVQ